MDATTALAEFAVTAGAFPALARQRAVDAMTDCVGCLIAGAREPLAKPMIATTALRASPDQAMPALVIGTGHFATPADAALCNGTFAHALDFDDTNHPAYAHPSAVLVPALLAVAAETALSEATGADLVDAYLIGFELFGKLGRALNTQHYRRGWHATATFGTLAAAVAAGRLLRLDATTMKSAIGIAASAAGGLRANFGSMVKPLHAGYAARNGVLAARLARSGFESGADALDHRYGFFGVFNDGIGHDIAPLLRLGQDLEVLTEHGLALKPYPSCGATHPGIEAALRLRSVVGDAPIRRVRAGVCDMAFAPLIHVMPTTPLQGKFSLHYCIAAALVDGKVDLTTFTPERVADPRIRSLIECISMEADPRWRDDSEFRTEIEIETHDGGTVRAEVPLAAGKPARWFDERTIRAKFNDCTRTLRSDHRDLVFANLRALDGTSPARGLQAVLAGFSHDRSTPAAG